VTIVESAPRDLSVRPLAPLSQVAIVVVAYNAQLTIDSVLGRIPATVAEHVGAILVSDDCSCDNTSEVARRWAAAHPATNTVVSRRPVNLGYGGNQKFAYEWAREQGYRFVLMVHGDGQYAPELATRMLSPLLSGQADATFGSRMLARGGARLGGMPLYKLVGNRILTRVQNAMTGLRLSEWHTGYRGYDLRALAPDRLAPMSNGFDFDTEIILELARTRARIVELPIPTFYGDEKCHVSGLRYAKDVLIDVVRYRFGHGTSRATVV
jgi:glycosyltransferase involved in cell wall biosynthesis